MKRLMSVTIAIALVLAQAVMAQAVIDKQYGNGFSGTAPENAGSPFTALATPTVASGAAATLVAKIKDVANPANTATSIGWPGVNLGAGWINSAQYLELEYYAFDRSWGLQIYTDNMNPTSGSTRPYDGDPSVDLAQQPAGLIGQTNNRLTCPVAILVEDANISSSALQAPVQSDPANPGSMFVSGYDADGNPNTPDLSAIGITTPTGAERVWFFLKDKNNTRWEDKNSNGRVDLDVTGPSGTPDGKIDALDKAHANYEIVSSFNLTGDDYATLVTASGYSSGWVDAGSLLMGRIFDLGAQDGVVVNPGNTPAIRAYTLNVYFAANFSKARESQDYKTDTITLELYHQ